ncbi:hypothetical protein O1611_g7541 [Lasiodiplodia mahajangana]|uniref:Uncharacterized protein n=1 Tax=Lasiodiplodia mahajangana TaxID=1108764 RepID=A0ACC2JF23_9PEZI|nr:hypothetical protein O1611_g7541 [Lasiodiplodia mahajangana]
MTDAGSNTAVQGSAGYLVSTTQTQQGQASASTTEQMRRYLDNPMYSVAAFGVGGPSRAGSDRATDYLALFASVGSLVPQRGATSTGNSGRS